MKIITNLSALGLEYPHMDASSSVWADFKKEVIAELTSAYDGEKNDAEAYLPSFEDFWDIRYGVKDSGFIKNTASLWNAEIKTTFCNSVNHVCENNLSVDTLHVRDSTTYSMMKAAMELHDRWSAFSDHGVYLENECGYPYFRCFLDSKTEADIQNHPEEYIVVTVYPKG